MCLTVMVVNPDPDQDGYRLILAFNREVSYARPTKLAEFWEQEPDIISGRDMVKGKEGGTWLGMNKTGQLAVLLNVLQPEGINYNAKGRGSLVSNFLQGRQDGQSYLQEVARNRGLYNGFHLITTELRKTGSVDFNYFTNYSEDGMGPIALKPGIYAFSNHTFGTSWPRTNYVRREFERIIGKSHYLTKAELTDELWTLMWHEKPLVSHPSILNQDISYSSEVVKELVFVQSNTFGTRSTTLILVDASGEVTYSERTLRHPISHASRVWDQTCHTFNMM